MGRYCTRALKKLKVKSSAGDEAGWAAAIQHSYISVFSGLTLMALSNLWKTDSVVMHCVWPCVLPPVCVDGLTVNWAIADNVNKWVAGSQWDVTSAVCMCSCVVSSSTRWWLEADLIGWGSQHNGASIFSPRASCCPLLWCLHEYKLVRCRCIEL